MDNKITYGAAIQKALHDELSSNESVVLFGQDIQHNLYGYTDKFLQKFGAHRIINTPISEAGVVGTAIGSAMCGLRPIVDLTVASFLYVAMDQIVNMASKTIYMYDGQFELPVTIMCGVFYSCGNAAQHSDRPHAMFMNVPGIKIVAPANPQDAYSLLRASVADKNPVIYFADRSFFNTEGAVDYNIKATIGKAKVVNEGSDVTIIAIMGCVKMALDLIPEFDRKNITVEVIDVSSLAPIDVDAIKKSVSKTGRVVIADIAHKTSSAASEIASIIAEEVFPFLKAPIGIVAYDNVPVPFAKNLEQCIMPTKAKIFEKVLKIKEY